MQTAAAAGEKKQRKERQKNSTGDGEVVEAALATEDEVRPMRKSRVIAKSRLMV